MPITSIRPKDEKEIGTNQMVLLVEGDNPVDMVSKEARTEVLRYARALGFPASGLSTTPSPYPVNEDGETNEDIVLGRAPFTHWQVEYVVNAGLR